MVMPPTTLVCTLTAKGFTPVCLDSTARMRLSRSRCTPFGTRTGGVPCSPETCSRNLPYHNQGTQLTSPVPCRQAAHELLTAQVA